MDRFDDTLSRYAETLLRHVIPLFSVPPGKRPSLIGTGVLVSSGQHTYVVSARHVIDHGTSVGRLYYYTRASKLVQLYGRVLRTAALPENEGADRFDVSVVRLADNSDHELGELLKVPVALPSLQAFRLPRREKEYLVTGFPRSKSRADPSSKLLKSQPQAFRVVSTAKSHYDKLGLSEASHLVMRLDIANMRFPDGSLRRIADPHGMSGSPLWLLYDSNGQNDRTFTPLVGTVIEYHKDSKLLVATDIGVALDLIRTEAAA